MDESLTGLEVGDCINPPGFGVEEVESVDTVDCRPGALEVIESFALEGDEYPGDEAVQAETGDRCPVSTVFTLYPTQESWENADDRLVVCLASVD